MRRVAILWMLLLGSSAASALDVPLTVDGRSFSVHVPPSYKEAEPAPVVVLLHGYTSSGAWAEDYMEFEPLSDQEGFLYVYPDGTLDCLNPPNRFWNATNACCNFCGKSVDDVGFLSGVLDELEAEFTVDTDRIYFVGHSNGGFHVVSDGLRGFGPNCSHRQSGRRYLGESAVVQPLAARPCAADSWDQ